MSAERRGPEPPALSGQDVELRQPLGRAHVHPFALVQLGTPSPGGINWREAQYILERCVAGRRVVGLDVVELAPIEGLHHADFTAAKLTHLIMGLAHDANNKE